MRRFILASILLCAGICPTACTKAPETNATPAADAASAPDALTADPTHYTVLFENDIASLIRVKVPAGAKSTMHSHPASCAIFWQDQKFKMTTPSGEVSTGESHAGEVSCDNAYTHLPENVGASDAELVLLHLKNRKTFDNVQTGKGITIPSQPNVPDAVTADPAHYAVQFENDAVRLLRVKLPPGGKTPMHAHPAHCIVELKDSTGVDANGKPTEAKAGDVECNDSQAHMGQNMGKTPIEFIAVEFKNRDKFKS